MGRLTTVCVISLVVVLISGLPIDRTNFQSNEVLRHLKAPVKRSIDEDVSSSGNVNVTNEATNVNDTRNSSTLLRSNIRPGMLVTSYTVTIEPNLAANTFSAELIAQIHITDAGTREDPILFHQRDLNIQSVLFSVSGGSLLTPADFAINDDDQLEINTGFEASLYSLYITYSGSLSSYGNGLYVGNSPSSSYLAMNLFPANARRVFPCVDEPTEPSVVSFTFNNVGFTSMVANSMLEDNSITTFRPLAGPVHNWGMVAHNFINVNIPTTNVLLFGRQGVAGQDSQASVAINSFVNSLNEWTNKNYFEIIVDQDGRMNIFALPDLQTDWTSLSVIGIWEPYVFMDTSHSIRQRYLALSTIAESIARQWFGFVIYPENWRYQWILNGLGSYAAFEVLDTFQDNSFGVDITLLDVNTLFVTEIIQESLLLDSYASSIPLEAADDLYEEEEIRDTVYGLRDKAAAIMKMTRNVLGGANEDFIQTACRALLSTRALDTVNTLNFVDAINSEFRGNAMVDDFLEFIEPWATFEGYPLLHVSSRQGGVIITQERFSLGSLNHVGYTVPVSFTTRVNPNFDDVYPQTVVDGSLSLSLSLGDEDWILLNIQGQGYYRVRYDNELWDRIIGALSDPFERELIHPLNRATLIDDALNLARAGSIDYDIALQVVLTMEHETEYAVWKAFVRNMKFLKKRLEAYVSIDEELDPDIYLRMVRRTIVAFEEEIGFYPDTSVTEAAMVSLTRGLVMDHACRANYQPCIAAAIDWFWDPNSNEPAVNPDIPYDMRPAVYCTMVKEGEDDAINALMQRMEVEASLYERVVIMEALACSQNSAFINSLLSDTINPNNGYTTQERLKIFEAVAESSYENAFEAINFAIRNTNEIRDMYGGPRSLERAMFVLSENMADGDLSTEYSIWIFSTNNNIGDSDAAGERFNLQVALNNQWGDAYLEYVYEWIDDNDAPTLMASLFLVSLSIILGIINQ